MSISDTQPNILIVEARFYGDLADALCDGAMDALDAASANVTRVAVPGVLEIPPAIAYAAQSGRYDGYVALGVVIRGETSHYDIVCNESARGLMSLGIEQRLAIGNGIQTVEDAAQAWARARKTEKNKGGGAAQAALALINLRDHFAGQDL